MREIVKRAFHLDSLGEQKDLIMKLVKYRLMLLSSNTGLMSPSLQAPYTGEQARGRRPINDREPQKIVWEEATVDKTHGHVAR